MRHPFEKFLFGTGFGPRVSPVTGASTLHLAQDYGVPRGTPVLAPADGLVTASYRTVPGGWWTFLRLDTGDTVGVCHSDQQSPHVGAFRREGEQIALSGNSGTATTGPHAHVTVRVIGVYVDPRRYFDNTRAATDQPPVLITAPPDQEENIMTTFYRPTENSSPLPDGTARIWAGGPRLIAGVTFSPVWGIDDTGQGRRLTQRQWEDISSRSAPGTVPISGNQLEQIIYAPRF